MSNKNLFFKPLILIYWSIKYRHDSAVYSIENIIFQTFVAPAPQTPRSEEWAWIECGRSTP